MPRVTTDIIGWASSQDHAGPFFSGAHPYVLPNRELSIADRTLAVLYATNMGNYSTVNMCDSNIVSLGCMQWSEANSFAVSDMLGIVADECGEEFLLEALEIPLLQSNSTFKKNGNGRWRFFIQDEEIKNIRNQQKLFLGCDGKKGSWSPISRGYAIAWATCLANIWNVPEARVAQDMFVIKRLNDEYILKEAKSILYGEDTPIHDSLGWPGALRATYAVFACNLPIVANRKISNIVSVANKPWSEEWCLKIIHDVVLSSGIDDYAERYDEIAPIVSHLFDVKMPITSEELKRWSSTPSLNRSRIKTPMPFEVIKIDRIPIPSPPPPRPLNTPPKPIKVPTLRPMIVDDKIVISKSKMKLLLVSLFLSLFALIVMCIAYLRI